jgi:molybdopterin/thiamine biosynthesis adenylyltransferase
MTSEQDRVRQSIEDYMRGQSTCAEMSGMGYDEATRSFMPMSEIRDPDNAIRVTEEDMGRYSEGSGDVPTVVFSFEAVRRWVNDGEAHDITLSVWDNGDVYTFLEGMEARCQAFGSVWTRAGTAPLTACSGGKPGDRVRIVVSVSGADPAKCQERDASDALPSVQAYVRRASDWQEARTQILPGQDELFARHRGLLETGVLADQNIFIAGVGSGGSAVAVELAKSGIMHFQLMDHDRLEVCNVVRHASPISHVGRYKTKSVKDLILSKNPSCNVQTWETEITWDNTEFVRARVRESDLVIVGADSPDGRTIINKLCVEEKTPCIMAGVRRRAYGGQVLRIRPGESLCHQCYVRLSPGEARDVEVATDADAERIAYSDRPAPVEPGLSTDIAPINIMVAKLAIQELLRGKPTTFHTLDEDLTAPLYLWLNRRETDSPFAKLEPLGYNVDGLHVLRWYGLPAKRDPACPVCGDFVGHLAESMNFNVPEEDAKVKITEEGVCRCS